MQTIYPQQPSEVDYSSYRAILNLIKQRYRLDINYTDVVYGKANAHGASSSCKICSMAVKELTMQ
jgi:hypothetical protein